MKPILFHRKARAELDLGSAYYEEQRAGLGLDFLQEVEQATARIQQNPNLHALYKETGFRKCILQRFPYSIFYMELEEYIWIGAVAHRKQRPDYWIRRTPPS